MVIGFFETARSKVYFVIIGLLIVYCKKRSTGGRMRWAKISQKSISKSSQTLYFLWQTPQINQSINYS